MDDQLSDLEHIRKRPGMYIGDTMSRGLHHLMVELVDNVVDQFLASRATTLRIRWDDKTLTVGDDGAGLPFDVKHESGQSLATLYMTDLRRQSPTADGHTPHIHFGGWGVGLRVVSALTSSCKVRSWRNGDLWYQGFTKGVADGPAKIVESGDDCGTQIEIIADDGIFKETKWNETVIERRMMEVAHLIPGLRIAMPSKTLHAQRGLAEWCEFIAQEKQEWNGEPSFWMHGQFGDLHIQMGAAGESDKPDFHAYANGNLSYEGGTHVNALKRALSNCGWKPSIAALHVIMDSPNFAGPTKTKLDMPRLFSPIYQVIAPALKEFVEAR